MGLDRPALLPYRLFDLGEGTVQLGEEDPFPRFVHGLRLEEGTQALQNRNLDVHQGEQFFLVQSRDEVWISRRRDGRLRRPEMDHLVQVHAEADDDPEDEQEQEECGLQIREAKLLRENWTEDDREDTHEGEDREDDPDDAAA